MKKILAFLKNIIIIFSVATSLLITALIAIISARTPMFWDGYPWKIYSVLFFIYCFFLLYKIFL